MPSRKTWQCEPVHWPSPPLSAKKNFVYCGFNAFYGRLEDTYARLIGPMVHRSVAMSLVALTLAALGIWGLTSLTNGDGYSMISLLQNRETAYFRSPAWRICNV